MYGPEGLDLRSERVVPVDVGLENVHVCGSLTHTALSGCMRVTKKEKVLIDGLKMSQLTPNSCVVGVLSWLPRSDHSNVNEH